MIVFGYNKHLEDWVGLKEGLGIVLDIEIYHYQPVFRVGENTKTHNKVYNVDTNSWKIFCWDVSYSILFDTTVGKFLEQVKLGEVWYIYEYKQVEKLVNKCMINGQYVPVFWEVCKKIREKTVEEFVEIKSAPRYALLQALSLKK